MLEFLSTANHAVRLVGGAVLLIWATFILRDVRTHPSSKFGLLLILSGVSFLTVNHMAARMVPPWMTIILAELSRSSFAFLWLFAASLNNAAFRFRPSFLAVIVAWELAYWLLWLPPRLGALEDGTGLFAPYLAVIDGIPSQVFLIAEFCFGAALLAATVKWIAHSGKPLRPAGEQRAIDTFLACCAAMLATDITFSTFRITLATGDLFSLELFLVIQNALVTALALAALIWFVGARRLQGPHLADLPDVTMPMNPLEKRIVEVLERGVYLDSELTVTTLAQKTGCTVAALRACISEELGYANFRQMINHYRIESAKEALRSSKHGLLSIQDVALTSGFKSMASFHRIFKDATSQTPSAYRTSTGDKP